MEREATKLGEAHGFVMVPTRRKFPKNVPGYQKLHSSYEGAAWKKATGYAIVTGETSGITVVDVDKPAMEWFRNFECHHNLSPTTTVETPGGGLHLYYKYDARIKQTQGLWGNDVAVDTRNNGGVIMAPGSPYDVDPKSKKAVHIGERYKFKNGKNFYVIAPMPDIWFEVQTFGLDGLDIAVPKLVPVETVTRDVTNGRTETNHSHFMNYVVAVGRKHAKAGWYDKWLMMVWSICQVCKDNRWDLLETALEFSKQLPGFAGEKYVKLVVERFEENRGAAGLPLLLSEKYVERNDPARIKFLKSFRRTFYFMDHVNLLSQESIQLREVHDFLSTAVLKVCRAGTPMWYLRYESEGVDDWRVFKGQGNPFKGDNKGFFNYKRKRTAKELAKEIEQRQKDENDEKVDPDELISASSSFVKQLLTHQYVKIPTYNDIVFRPFYGKDAPCSSKIYNQFQGYRHEALTDEQMVSRLSVKKTDADFKFLMKHWEETMCDGDKTMFEYVMNWQSYLLQIGYKKLPTFLVFIGAQGVGKNLMWEKLFINGILGKELGNVVNDLRSFQSNFNSRRLNKCLHFFNECTSINSSKSKTNWDKIKGLSDLTFSCELKGKEAFRAEDPAACVFCSNHQAPVLLENDDRRFAVTSMSKKYQRNRNYFIRLARIVANQSIQQIYFTYLIARDVSNWDPENIPMTEVRKKLKEDKSYNHILKYMNRVVNVARSTTWYNHDNADPKKAYYSKARFMKSWDDWCDDNNIRKWDHTIIEQRLLTNGLPKSRVTDRSLNGVKKQIICYQLNKDIVRNINRSMLNNAEWNFPVLPSPDVDVADVDRCVVIELNKDDVTRL